jgi:hypothetical protein
MANGFASAQDSVKQHLAQQPLPPAIDAESVQAQWQSQFAEL